MVYPNGYVLWIIKCVFTISCRIDVRFFPFDFQHCIFNFGSWAYLANEINLTLFENYQASNVHESFIVNGVWDLFDAQLNRAEVNYPKIGRFTEINVTLAIARRPFFYVLTVIIPCGLLSLINLMVFILPTESGEKVSLGITNVLALVLFQQLIGETMPPTSDKLPLICKCNAYEYHF